MTRRFPRGAVCGRHCLGACARDPEPLSDAGEREMAGDVSGQGPPQPATSPRPGGRVRNRTGDTVRRRPRHGTPALPGRARCVARSRSAGVHQVGQDVVRPAAAEVAPGTSWSTGCQAWEPSSPGDLDTSRHWRAASRRPCGSSGSRPSCCCAISRAIPGVMPHLGKGPGAMRSNSPDSVNRSRPCRERPCAPRSS